MKTIVTIFFIVAFTNFIFAFETCEEMKKRQSENVRISKMKAKKNYIECLSREKRATNYRKWLKPVTWETKDAYYVPKNTVTCITRESAIAAYNHVRGNGGVFYPKNINSRWRDCVVLDGWSIARIIERKNKSNVVKLQYLTREDSVEEKYVVQDSIILLGDYKKTLAH